MAEAPKMSAAAARFAKQRAKREAESLLSKSLSPASGSSATEWEGHVSYLIGLGDEASLYESLQLLSSHSHRASKAGDVDRALQIAVDGALTLLRFKHVEIASPLACLLADTLRECRAVETSARLSDISSISALFAGCCVGIPPHDGRREHHVKFLRGALRWNTAVGATQYGATAIHELLGDALWGTEEQADAVSHYAFAEKPDVIAERMFSTGLKGGSVGRDNLLVQAVLTFLTLENMRDANALMSKYKAALLKTSEKTLSKNVNFCVFLLKICERNGDQMFKWLFQAFGQSMQNNQAWVSMLTRIGKIYFGIKPPPNMLSMIESMLGGGGMGGQQQQQPKANTQIKRGASNKGF
jgi:hypothetical protein